MSDPSQTKHHDGQSLLDAMDRTTPQKVAVCAAHMMLKDGSTVLDAGCANGMTTAYFAMKYPEVHFIGVDYDGEYIAKAKASFGHLKNIEFIQADLRDFSLQGRKIDAALNLSILHEPFSYDGYRAQTVLEILTSELEHAQVYGTVVNRDFVLPDNPDDMVYIALPDDGAHDGDDYNALSMAEFFLRYSQEAMLFDGGDPQGHIKGFFTEEHTQRLSGDKNIPDNWRVFSVQHQFAWEFVWRMSYRDRFLNEAEEKYAFWTHAQHRKEPEKLGARVLFSAPYENPWLLENRYKKEAKILDSALHPLPLPPSNFISVLQKIPDGHSIALREHKTSETAPAYLRITNHINTTNGEIVDLVARPGGDVLDILPYAVDGDDLIVYAKDQYPRPIANIKPRMMSPNLDSKKWSGHMIEPLAAANTKGSDQDIIRTVLTERAGLSAASIVMDSIGSLHYYPAPAELNERVHAVRVELTDAPKDAVVLSGGHSGFSNDGIMRAFNAQSLLQAAQVGMLPEARLETGIYALMRERGIKPKEWLGQSVEPGRGQDIIARTVEEISGKDTAAKLFKPTKKKAGTLSVNRSEFHEIVYQNDRERILARKELEFAVPAKDVSTNTVVLACLVTDPSTGEPLLGVQKSSDMRAHFASVQNREGRSNLMSLPTFRLPSTVGHIQNVPAWIADKTGALESSIKRLGEGYFPSLGIIPNRVFPYVVSEASDSLRQRCAFVRLSELFNNIEDLNDLNLMNTVFRAVHALDLWPEQSGLSL